MHFLLLSTLLVSLVYVLSCRNDVEVAHSDIGQSQVVANEQASEDNGSPSTDDMHQSGNRRRRRGAKSLKPRP